jgi:UvrD-like helicase C-terminal domain
MNQECGPTRLGWAYASTVHGAQGMTVDRAVVPLDPRFDRHAIHVAASRAREETRLVVDRSQMEALHSSSKPNRHPPNTGAHSSPADYPTDTLRHRRSP